MNLSAACSLEVTGRGGDTGHEHVFEVVEVAHRRVEREEEPVEFAAADEVEQAVFAARHDPVDGGPAQAGFAGDVVERRLVDAPSGDAAKRGGDNSGLGIVVRSRRGERGNR